MKSVSTFKSSLAAAFAMSLAACGSTTSSTVTHAPYYYALADGKTAALTYDEVTKAYTVTVGVVDQSDISIPDTAANHGLMRGLVDATGTKYATVAQTENSLAYVAATNGAATNFSVVAYGRLTSMELPTAGSATFTGDYAGLFRVDNAIPIDNISGRIRGNISMDADFGAKTISGSITNRGLYDLSGVLDASSPMSDVALLEVSIAGAARFVGSTVAGHITNGNWQPTTGFYNGTISGPTAGEVVGSVNINHSTNSSVSYKEIGVYLATQ